MRLIPRRRKTGPAKAAETLVTALKLGAIVGAVQGATKGAGKGTKKAVKGTAAYKTSKKAVSRTPVLKRAPVVLAAGGAAVVAAKKLRSTDGSSPSQPQQTQQAPSAVPG
jgi:hypothetical protein